MTRDPGVAQYLAEAQSWDLDRAAQSRRSAKIAWIVAGLAGLGALLSSTALVLLVPLKQTELRVVRVDARTGIVDTVPAYTGTADVSETVTRYWLTHYVQVCQRYVDEVLAENDYLECGSFNSPAQNQRWAALWARSNPQSPLNLYADGTHVSVTVSSITFLTVSGGQPLAQVRYVTAKKHGDAAEDTTHWIATIEYTYVDPSTNAQMRQFNPLGFRVVQCRAEVEAVSASPAAHPPQAGAR